MADADATYDLSSITTDQLRALEQQVYADVLRRVCRTQYTTGGEVFSFSDLDQVRRFLRFIQEEIQARSVGGYFTLATMLRE